MCVSFAERDRSHSYCSFTCRSFSLHDCTFNKVAGRYRSCCCAWEVVESAPINLTSRERKPWQQEQSEPGLIMIISSSCFWSETAVRSHGLSMCCAIHGSRTLCADLKSHPLGGFAGEVHRFVYVYFLMMKGPNIWQIHVFSLRVSWPSSSGDWKMFSVCFIASRWLVVVGEWSGLQE